MVSMVNFMGTIIVQQDAIRYVGQSMVGQEELRLLFGDADSIRNLSLVIVDQCSFLLDDSNWPVGTGQLSADDLITSSIVL
jgi:hypothetical protein